MTTTITGWWEGRLFCTGWVEDHEELGGMWERESLPTLKKLAREKNIVVIDDETGKEI